MPSKFFGEKELKRSVEQHTPLPEQSNVPLLKLIECHRINTITLITGTSYPHSL